MGPEFHLAMVAHRTAELRKEADDYRRVRAAEESRRDHCSERRRRGLLGKIAPA